MKCYCKVSGHFACWSNLDVSWSLGESRISTFGTSLIISLECSFLGDLETCTNSRGRAKVSLFTSNSLEFL